MLESKVVEEVFDQQVDVFAAISLRCRRRSMTEFTTYSPRTRKTVSMCGPLLPSIPVMGLERISRAISTVPRCTGQKMSRVSNRRSSDDA